MSHSNIRIGVVGATGYTGVELLRLLAQHPYAELAVVTSRQETGNLVSDLFPNLKRHIPLRFSELSDHKLNTCDVVFFATPNGTAMQYAPALLDQGIRVIDLSADFRLKSAEDWQTWYGMPHTCTSWLEQAVYGLPEINRAHIKHARLIANPGCYPTAIQLGFMPLLKAGVVDTNHLIADAKSGVSGAGRKAELHTAFAEISDNFRAYGVSGHRHFPEIKQGLSQMTEHAIHLTFVPHLTPMLRGIHATLYAPLTQSVNLQALFSKHYAEEFFVDVLPPNRYPDTRTARGSNLCHIAVCQPQHTETVVVLSVIDNLVKGAAGQAIQNMNILFNFPETTGLCAPALLP